MMINSTTSTDRTASADKVSAQGNPVARQHAPRSDLLSTENAAFLRAELARQPEIRAEVLERAQALASNPDYPSSETIKRIAGLLLNSPDLSDDQS
jgi:hypothetical protein